MDSRPDSILTSSNLIQTNRQIRPTRVALIHGANISNADFTEQEMRNALIEKFISLNAHVFSSSEMTKEGMNDLISSSKYDVICFVGEVKDFDFIKKSGGSAAEKLNFRAAISRNFPPEIEVHKDPPSILLAFAPNSHFRYAKSYLRFAESIILCDLPEKNWILTVADLVYCFFESLILPSMLNIDLADVRHIAKGIGLAFSLSDDDYKKIISRLPKKCLVARSALLHFSCDPDVRLREVYSISKAITLKKSIANSLDSQINTHADARKVIRKVNVKMGIRMTDGRSGALEKRFTSRDLTASDYLLHKRGRISLTAIFFGL